MGKLVNRAKMTVSGTPGTAANITLGSAVAGFQTLAAAGVANGDYVSYVIEDGAAWEIGTGVYASSGTVLGRNLIASSTGSLLSLTSGAQVYVSPLASDLPTVVAKATIATGVNFTDFVLPSGYPRFFIRASNVAFSNAGANLGVRVSDSGNGGLKAGATDYVTQRLSATGTTVSAAQGTSSFGTLLNNQTAAGTLKAAMDLMLSPGGTGLLPSIIGKATFLDATPNLQVADVGVYYSGGTSGAIGRLNYVRLLADAGTFTGDFTVVGEP